MLGLKTRSILTLIIIATVFAAWLGFPQRPNGPPNDGNPSNDDKYVLSAKWIPHAMPLYNDVKIVVNIDGFNMPLVQRRLSPWQETMSAEKGATVRVTVTAHHPQTQLLDCIVLKNGHVNINGGYMSLPGAGSVTCNS